ncbi:unnamed protein product [Protopolystoma xenopodis]|uniref:ABC transmembrane type-1 domain-containing protein n=1 Tax=Protopolystoma xenopodis TaxID=117903 RepID=A0A3S5CDY2_9PLAT|nr:unnamed protein product [Protopolystoma xenopodis]
MNPSFRNSGTPTVAYSGKAHVGYLFGALRSPAVDPQVSSGPAAGQISTSHKLTDTSPDLYPTSGKSPDPIIAPGAGFGLETRQPGGSETNLPPKKLACSQASFGTFGNLGLVKALLVTYWPQLVVGFFLKLLHDILLFFSPVLLKLLLTFINEEKGHSAVNEWHGYLFAVSLFFTNTLQSIILQAYFKTMFILGMQINSVLVAAVYRKVSNHLL